MMKTDCFAYKNNNGHFRCTALHVDDCLNCNFYKTKEQLTKELQIIEERKKGKGVNV